MGLLKKTSRALLWFTGSHVVSLTLQQSSRHDIFCLWISSIHACICHSFLKWLLSCHTILKLPIKCFTTCFRYSKEIPDAYERLLLDAIEGERRLFIRSDELDAAWSLFTPLLKELEEKRIAPELYPYGSRGPVGAHYLAAKYNVRWGDLSAEHYKAWNKYDPRYDIFASISVILHTQVLG